MLDYFKETILRALINKGWSCEELDYRINEREGFTAELIAGSSVCLDKDIKRRICSLLDISEPSAPDDETFTEELIRNLYNFTKFGHLKWNKINGRVAVSVAENPKGIKSLTIKNDAKGMHEGTVPEASEVEAGPSYHIRTRNGLDVYISISERIPFTITDESRKFSQNIYVTDKRGYILAYSENGRATAASTYEGKISAVFFSTFFRSTYETILEYYNDELYEYPF